MEEKVSEIHPEKIDTIVSTKDEKTVNDKNEERKMFTGRLTVNIAEM